MNRILIPFSSLALWKAQPDGLFKIVGDGHEWVIDKTGPPIQVALQIALKEERVCFADSVRSGFDPTMRVTVVNDPVVHPRSS